MKIKRNGTWKITIFFFSILNVFHLLFTLKYSFLLQFKNWFHLIMNFILFYILNPFLSTFSTFSWGGGIICLFAGTDDWSKYYHRDWFSVYLSLSWLCFNEILFGLYNPRLSKQIINPLYGSTKPDFHCFGPFSQGGGSLIFTKHMMDFVKSGVRSRYILFLFVVITPSLLSPICIGGGMRLILRVPRKTVHSSRCCQCAVVGVQAYSESVYWFVLFLHLLPNLANLL